MRSFAGFAAILLLAIGLTACGKYGPPERSVVPQETSPVPWPTAPQPMPPEESQVPEERIPEPDDFDDAETDLEVGP